MSKPIPILQPTKVLANKDYKEVLCREMDSGKIPISLGKSCPVKCEFCYELDHSYRETLEPPKTTQEDWESACSFQTLRFAGGGTCGSADREDFRARWHGAREPDVDREGCALAHWLP